MINFILNLQRDQRGVSSMEYAVLAGIIVIAVVAAGSVLSNTSTGLPHLFTELINTVNNAVQGNQGS